MNFVDWMILIGSAVAVLLVILVFLEDIGVM